MSGGGALDEVRTYYTNLEAKEVEFYHKAFL